MTPHDIDPKGYPVSYPHHVRPDRAMVQPAGHISDQPPVMMLTVSEIERLAKAGVKLDWAELRGLIAPDPETPEPIFDSSYLTRPLVVRVNRAMKGTNEFQDVGACPFFFSAVEWNGMVYVFVANGSSTPVILEDDIKLYPSDALMAKLLLLTELHKK